MELQDQTDNELIQLCREGNENAFAVLYQRYRLRLFAYIHKLLPEERDVVEDIFQHTWCKAVRNWNRYDDRQRFLAWLCRIAHNMVMDHYRAARHWDKEPLTSQDAVSEDEDVYSTMDKAAFRQALEGAIETLPENQREVLEARRAGSSFKEIAEMQQCTINTVLGRMHYAILKLRETLKEYLP